MRSKSSNAQLGAQAEALDAGAQVPSGHETLLCEKTFAGFCKSLPDKDIDEAVLLCLVEGDMRLLRIASARARRDGATAAREANALGQMAASLGFLQAAGLARQAPVGDIASPARQHPGVFETSPMAEFHARILMPQNRKMPIMYM